MAGADGPQLEVAEDVAQAKCAKCGQAMVLKKGRFGPFLACVGYPECRSTQRLVRASDGKYQIETFAPIEEKCPECGHDLAWRRGRFGPFIACSSYPACKYVKKNEAREIGVVCPECGQGQLVERKGRWGRFFYGCRRYPDCKFTAQHQPLAEPCPKCGRAYLLQKENKKQGRVVFCGNEGCDYERAGDETG
jgi:DNA topoisomerase-1